MDDPRRVGRCQARTQRDEDLDAGPPVGPGFLPHPILERLSFDQLHGHEGPALDLAHLVHMHHVGVRQLGQRLGLTNQASGMALTDIAMQDLERHLPIELGVIGSKHDPHAPASQLVEHYIAPSRVQFTCGLE